MTPNPTILIVDDEPINLSVLTQVLSKNYRVRAGNSGERALQVAASEPTPDLILLDVMMPEMDGYSVLSRLMQDPVTQDIPVIFVTAMEAAEDEEKGLAMGAVDYITKPIMPAILLARVKAHITLKQARDYLHDKNAYLEAEVARRMEENQTIQNVSIRALAHPGGDSRSRDWRPYPAHPVVCQCSGNTFAGPSPLQRHHYGTFH